jgi:hypothetical protein
MAICSTSQNAAIPGWLTPIGSQLTPAMQQQAAVYAYDGTIAINSVFKQWVGGLPVAFLVNCHSYTVNADGSQTPGAYHGTSVFLITDPAQYPPLPSTGVNWPLVGATGGAIALVVGSFFLAIRLAGKAANRRS